MYLFLREPESLFCVFIHPPPPSLYSTAHTHTLSYIPIPLSSSDLPNSPLMPVPPNSMFPLFPDHPALTNGAFKIKMFQRKNKAIGGLKNNQNKSV